MGSNQSAMGALRKVAMLLSCFVERRLLLLWVDLTECGFSVESLIAKPTCFGRLDQLEPIHLLRIRSVVLQTKANGCIFSLLLLRFFEYVIHRGLQLLRTSLEPHHVSIPA